MPWESASPRACGGLLGDPVAGSRGERGKERAERRGPLGPPRGESSGSGRPWVSRLPKARPHSERVTAAPSTMALVGRTAMWWARLRSPYPAGAPLCFPPWRPAGLAADWRLYSSRGKVSPRAAGSRFACSQLGCRESPEAAAGCVEAGLAGPAVSPWSGSVSPQGCLRPVGRTRTCGSKLRHPARDTVDSAA